MTLASDGSATAADAEATATELARLLGASCPVLVVRPDDAVAA